MASLSYVTAARIATRELRSSPGKFFFVLVSVAIGVAALTGVRGSSAAFRSMLLLRARSIMAADIAARMTEAPTATEQASLDKLTGVDQTGVIEMLSMASASTAPDPLLVALKAVDPAKYPFYGKVVLQPALPLGRALTDTSVAVGDDLLLRLHLHIGGEIRLGDTAFRIAAAVVDEPDRLTGSFAAGPRILLSQQALASTGLLAPGSRATRRLLFKLQMTKAQPASDARVTELRRQLEAILPQAEISDYREANPSITRALDGATGLLSLMSLVALVLAAVGVAMAIRAHIEERLDSIAVMKSLGATSPQIIRIYLLQTLLLGLGGAMIGLALGLCVQLALPLFLIKLLHLMPGFHLDLHAALLGLAAGVLTTLLFTLPPLLDIRNIRPILILRRAVEKLDETEGFGDRTFFARARRYFRGSSPQLAATVLIVVGLAALAATVSDSRQVGGWFASGLLVELLVLLGAATLMLRAIRLFLNGTRRQLPSVLRHGLANLYRPGNPSAALLAALGLGVMQIAAVSLVQHSIVGEMQATTAAKLPNLFLIDIATDELPGVRALLTSQAAVQGVPEIVPVVGARLVAIDNVPAAQLHLKHMSRRALNSIDLTWAPKATDPPLGDRVVSGHWWTTQQFAAAATHPLVALERHEAERLNARVGDSITFEAEGQSLPATVAALFEADSKHAFSRADMVLPESALRGFPVSWYAGLHCDPAATGLLRRVLYQHYPTITVIDVAATVETVRQVLLQVSYIIQFLAAFSTFAGIVILASAVAGTRFRRIREVVVLKTLGATRPRIAAIFSIEFAVLGLIAAVIGLIFANILARILLLHVFHFAYHLQWLWNVAAGAITTVLTVAAGWLASHRVLGQKPLEVLREE